MRPWLSVLGLYKYDNTIFDKLTLPVKAELRSDLDLIEPAELDKNLLIGKILMDLGELSLIYTDPDILKDMIEIWGDVNHDNFLALWETLLYKYNPIWNKDGTITETGSNTKSGTTSITDSGTTSITDSGTHSDTWSEKTVTDSGRVIAVSASENSSTSGQSSETKTHSVTGYDTNSYSPDTQDATSGTSSGTGSVTQTSTTHDDLDSEVNVTGSKSGTTGNTRSGTTENTRSGTTGETGSNSVTRVEQGNIGVTTTQQMIREQREIVQFNLYEFMCESFKYNFCLMVY